MRRIEDRVQAVAVRELLIMRPNAKVNKWVYLNKTHVYLALIVVDVIYFGFIVDRLRLVNLEHLLV